MIEISPVRQIPGEPMRRWFSSAEFDLFVQCDPTGRFLGFQLCYDKPHREQALVFSEGEGFRHVAVDDGEQRPGKYKASPVLNRQGRFDARRVYQAFNAAGADLPPEVAAYVRTVLQRHPDWPGAD
jgi:hypothetical protein